MACRSESVSLTASRGIDSWVVAHGSVNVHVKGREFSNMTRSPGAELGCPAVLMERPGTLGEDHRLEVGEVCWADLALRPPVYLRGGFELDHLEPSAACRPELGGRLSVLGPPFELDGRAGVGEQLVPEDFAFG